VELGGRHGAPLDGGHERHAIVTPRAREESVAGLRIVRVHEIEVGAGGDALEEPKARVGRHSVPPHVRNLATGRKTADDAWDDVETASVTEFLAPREQELVAQADAEKGSASVEGAMEGVDQTETGQGGHGVVKGPAPGQDHGVGLVHDTRRLRHPRRHADAPEGLLHAAEIAAPVVDDGDHRLYSTPFVEGSTPAMRGLRRLASARARPTALKHAPATGGRCSPSSLFTRRHRPALKAKER